MPMLTDRQRYREWETKYRSPGENGTWCHPEEWAYRGGLWRSARRCGAIDKETGQLIRVRVGLPFTWFHIAAVHHGSKGNRRGFVTCDDGTYFFHAFKKGTSDDN